MLVRELELLKENDLSCVRGLRRKQTQKSGWRKEWKAKDAKEMMRKRKNGRRKGRERTCKGSERKEGVLKAWKGEKKIERRAQRTKTKRLEGRCKRTKGFASPNQSAEKNKKRNTQLIPHIYHIPNRYPTMWLREHHTIRRSEAYRLSF